MIRKLTRRLGSVLIVTGVVLVVYTALVVFWRDPVTGAYTAYEQHQMGGSLDRSFREWQSPRRDPTPAVKPGPVPPSSSAVRARARGLALAFAAANRGHTGRPIARIRIPRIGLSTITVEGTDYWGSLSKGPGRYERGDFPGMGETTGIAGHRTTFEAPFRHIDEIRDGDPITIAMPYGTFTYRVLRHRIVDDGDWSIMRRVGFDELVLSACHPIYSAAQRYVVFARLASVALPGAKAVTIT